MKTPLPEAEAAAAYRRLLAQEYPAGLAEDELWGSRLTAEQLQECWLRGRLGTGGATQHHGPVRILDFGEWVPSGHGPCFRRAELALAGQRLCGDVQVDIAAEDWETSHRSENSAFNGVLLHIVLRRPPEHWFTRSADDREIPLMVLDPERAEDALGRSLRSGKSRLSAPAALADMPLESLRSLLQSAAAHRCTLKRRYFREREAEAGSAQAWYEAWAETLGYGGNSLALLQLARRVPYAEAAAGDLCHSLAMLMGAAGFLVPVMPARATEAEHRCHKELWAHWWQHRERLSRDYPLHWRIGPVRPLNHPHRRVAALALSAVSGVFDSAPQPERLSKLSDAFWEMHYSLYAPAMAKAAHIVGRSTVTRFLVNHVLPVDESAEAWGRYLSLRADTVPVAVVQAARVLFGEHPDLRPLLRLHYAQQGLLQLAADFELNAEN